MRLHVVDVLDIEGDASVTFTRKKLRHIFDFSFSVKWSIKLDSITTIDGKLFFPEFSGDNAAGEDIEAELRWEGRSKAGSMQNTIQEVVMSQKYGGLKCKVIQTLREFQKVFMGM